MSEYDPDTCKHDNVSKSVSEPPVWACQHCGTGFLPAGALAYVEQQNEEVLDTVTAVFSAVLWELHERAFEAHGIPHGQGGELEEAVCDQKGHEVGDAGMCVRCGHSPFLGGGS